MQHNRRDFIKLAGAGATLSALAACAPMAVQSPTAKARVVVVGGGFGGATAAKYVKMGDPTLDVTLVERDASFITCPFSNYVIAGFREIGTITHGYDGLRKRGIHVVRDEVTAIDTTARKVALKGGGSLVYDKLVVSPGIDLNYAGVPGYSEAASERMPHAWKAGAQTLLLRRQLEAMPDGGTVILCPPGNPFRCPPGPYERASVIAWYLKKNKPRSKILILDAKDAFSKQGLFQQGWEALYPGMVTWIAGKDGGKVESVDPAAMTVKAGFGAEKGAVINVIPPQRAGKIAIDAGLADANGWCPVDPRTFASTKVANVHVVGDASIAGAMPKSGSAANTQGKGAAAAIVAMLNGQTPGAPSYHNTCYSLLAPDYGISVTGVYTVTDKGLVEVPNSGGVSPRDAPAANRQMEATFTNGWYNGITADTFV
jgi:sulfide dehydrogenase [flavocytochrome c] flavoprotein subunit